MKKLEKIMMNQDFANDQQDLILDTNGEDILGDAKEEEMNKNASISLFFKDGSDKKREPEPPLKNN
jgi:hypothetical protein